MPKNTKFNCYANERKTFTKNMLSILNYDIKKGNTSIHFNKLIEDTTTKKSLEDMYPLYKKIFYVSGIKDSPSENDNYLLSMFKNVIKEMNYFIFSKEKKFTINGVTKNGYEYIVIPNTYKLNKQVKS